MHRISAINNPNAPLWPSLAGCHSLCIGRCYLGLRYKLQSWKEVFHRREPMTHGITLTQTQVRQLRCTVWMSTPVKIWQLRFVIRIYYKSGSPLFSTWDVVSHYSNRSHTPINATTRFISTRLLAMNHSIKGPTFTLWLAEQIKREAGLPFPALMNTSRKMRWIKPVAVSGSNKILQYITFNTWIKQKLFKPFTNNTLLVPRHMNFLTIYATHLMASCLCHSGIP